MEAADYRDLLPPLVAGRRFVLRGHLAVAAFAFADRELETGIGPLEPTREVR